MPTFTIITITFNNRDGLARTAQSIINQTAQDFEWLIIDGNSTDGTQQDFILYKRATIISEPDRGIYDAMNKGIDRSNGHYLIFMNAGDIFADKTTLEKIAPYTQSSPDLIYGDAFEGEHLKKSRPADKITWGMFTHHQAMFYKRISFGQMRYELNYKISADYDLTLRFLKSHTQTQYIPTPICVFETGGVSQTHAKLGRDEQFQSREQNAICSPLTNHIIRLGQIMRYKIRQYLPSLYWLSLKKGA